MAPEQWLASLRRLSLSILCLFAASLQVTSGGALDEPAPPPLAPLAPPAHGDHVTEHAQTHTTETSVVKFPKCDRTFVSRGAVETASQSSSSLLSTPPPSSSDTVGGIVAGEFAAPELLNPGGHGRQCLYTFLAAPGQRVEVLFTHFNLRGSPPDGAAVGELPGCFHEYMDIYSEVVSPEAGELINSPFGGRYCGPIPPRRRISLYRAVALSFFTDKNFTTSSLFNGKYSFINESEYEVGTPVPNTPCSFNVHAAKKKTGFILSPTYPGTYPKDTVCNYHFIGQPGQRIRLEFRDFDLFFGGPHCPFDWVRVYDGPDNKSAIVGTYCGQQRNLVLYSSDEKLLVTFSTLARAANTQNRGFKGIFEFSESFVKLDFISKYDGEHIRGSECDQKILSKKESSGFVFSPNYPFPYIPKIVCRYFIYGMQDSQNLERVRLEFQIFGIPRGEKGGESSCSDGYLKIYLKGQEVTDSYDKFDAELCGDGGTGEAATEDSMPIAPLVSDGPRLVMVFSSGELQGRGFKARYTFETEYLVFGTAAPDGSCTFTYHSDARKRGELNSPRYPSNYPARAECTYTLLATPNDQVTLVFDHFKVRSDSMNVSLEPPPKYTGHMCSEDWLEAWWISRSDTEVALGRWCGSAAPGPLQSPRSAKGLRLSLHSDDSGVASGFKARYIFEDAKSIFGDCGGNMSGMDYGVITSPNFPANYDGPAKGLASKTCNWYITVNVGFKILLHFDFFAVEGDPQGRGCPAAVLRLWYDTSSPPIELCGEKSPADKWQYVTNTNSLRLSFISADKTVGAAGWRMVWTEVSDCNSESTDSAGQVSCSGAGVCVPARMRCDGVVHCGASADDEAHCSDLALVDTVPSMWLRLGATIAGAVFLLIGALWWMSCSSNRKRSAPVGTRTSSRRRAPPDPCARRLAAAGVDLV